MSIVITPAHTEAEWKQIQLLQRALLHHEKTLRPQRKETAISSNGPLNYLRDNVVAKNGICLLAQQENIPAGFIAGWIEDGDGLDEGDNRIGHIIDVYVEPNFRGQKVFSTLLAEIKVHFKSQGITKLSTYTLGTNTEMQNILGHAGFSVHHIVYEMTL